jgi:hypothetical protein
MSIGRALLLALALVGCGRETPEEPAPTKVTFAPDEASSRFGAVPFPSDLQRDPVTQLVRISNFERIVGAHSDALRDGLGALDGFGRTTASVFFVDGAIDQASLPTRPEVSGSAMLIDVDPASPERGRRFPVLARALPSLRVVSVLPWPGTVLAPGRKYATVLTDRVRAANGTALAADERFVAMLGKRTTPAEQLYGGAIDALVESGAVPSARAVAGLAVFTTSRATSELPALRELVRAEPAPQTHFDGSFIFSRTTTPDLDAWLGTPEKDENGHDWPGLDNPGGVAHDAIGAIATFAYESPSFLDAKTKHIEGRVIADAHARVPVTIVVPLGAPPAEGFPVIVAAHGLGGTRNNLLAIANELARGGFVTIGIDDVAHGARRGARDLVNNYVGTYRGPDGLPDRDQIGGLDFFAGFIDLLAIRDNLRQTVLDHVSLIRLVQRGGSGLEPIEPALGDKLRLDPTRVFWTGGSFGGIMGATTVAIEPELRAAALQVPGGGFMHLLITQSPQMGGVVNTLIRTAYRLDAAELDETEKLDAFHPLANIAGTVIESGDPLAFAPEVFGKPRPRSPNVLLTYALDDEVLPNEATHALVRAMGLATLGTALRPIAGTARGTAPLTMNVGAGTGVAVEYAPATHALGYARFGERAFSEAGPLPRVAKIEMPIREHLAQVIHFFRTTEVIQTAPSRADFDGDGVLDEDERARGTDPFDPRSH